MSKIDDLVARGEERLSKMMQLGLFDNLGGSSGAGEHLPDSHTSKPKREARHQGETKPDKPKRPPGPDLSTIHEVDAHRDSAQQHRAHAHRAKLSGDAELSDLHRAAAFRADLVATYLDAGKPAAEVETAKQSVAEAVDTIGRLEASRKAEAEHERQRQHREKQISGARGHASALVSAGKATPEGLRVLARGMEDRGWKHAAKEYHRAADQLQGAQATVSQAQLATMLDEVTERRPGGRVVKPGTTPEQAAKAADALESMLDANPVEKRTRADGSKNWQETNQHAVLRVIVEKLREHASPGPEVAEAAKPAAAPAPASKHHAGEPPPGGGWRRTTKGWARGRGQRYEWKPVEWWKEGEGKAKPAAKKKPKPQRERPDVRPEENDQPRAARAAGAPEAKPEPESEVSGRRPGRSAGGRATADPSHDADAGEAEHTAPDLAALEAGAQAQQGKRQPTGKKSGPSIQLEADLLPPIPDEARIRPDIAPFPVPQGPIKDLYPHQREAAERILASWRERDGCLIADEAGLGKTLSGVAAMMQRGGRRNLIVVPTKGKRGLMRQWQDEGLALYGVRGKGKDELDPEIDGTWLIGYNDLYESVAAEDEFDDWHVVDTDAVEEILNRYTHRRAQWWSAGLADRAAEAIKDEIEWQEWGTRKNKEEIAELRRNWADAVEIAKRIEKRYQGDYPDGLPQRVMFQGMSELATEVQEDRRAAQREKLKGKRTRRLRKALFDGQFDTILFDECHGMVNQKTTTAKAGKLLQDQAGKVLYMSATPYTYIRDMSYLKRLGLFEPEFNEDKNRLETSDEAFIRWVVSLGGEPSEGWVADPKTPKAKVAVAAKMHTEGSRIKRVTSLEGTRSMFHMMPQESLSEDAQKTLEIGGKVFGIMERYWRSLAGAHYKNWSRQYLETQKVDAAVAIARRELEKNPNAQIAFFTSFKESDHGHIRNAPDGIRRLAERAAEDPEKYFWFDPAQAAEDIAEIEALIPQLPPVLRGPDGENEAIVDRLTREFGGPKKVAQIHGRTSKKPEVEQARYQSGEAKVAVCTMSKGGTGISLHDKVGNAPRIQINLSLPWTGNEFDQVKGRSHRLGSKSNTDIHWMVGDHPTEQHNAAICGKRLQAAGSLTIGNQDLAQDSAHLADFDEGDGAGADLTDDPAEAYRISHGTDRMIREGEGTDEGKEQRWHFRKVAERHRAGGDVVGEVTEHLEAQRKRKTELEARRASEQLKQAAGINTHWDPTAHVWVLDRNSLNWSQSEALDRFIARKTTNARSLFYLHETHIDAHSMPALAKIMEADKHPVDMRDVVQKAVKAERAIIDTMRGATRRRDIRMEPVINGDGDLEFHLSGNSFAYQHGMEAAGASLVDMGDGDVRRWTWVVPEQAAANVMENFERVDQERDYPHRLNTYGRARIDEYREMHGMDKSERLEALFARGNALRKGESPPSGFTQITGSAKGGWHKKEGNHYVYWYPGQGVVSSRHSSDVHADHSKLPEGFNKMPLEDRAEMTAHWDHVRQNLAEYKPRTYHGDTQAAVVEHLEDMRRAGNLVPSNAALAKKMMLTQLKHGRAAGIPEPALAKLMEENVRKLCMQEVESVGRTLGDHGVRHLAKNAEQTDRIFDAVVAGGGQITPMERFMAHQVHIDHDMGYTIGAIAKGGFAVADKYHPQASAVLVRQQADKYKALFGDKYQAFHQAVLTHSRSGVDWKNDPFTSAIRLADNTHLFADKLPEVLMDSRLGSEVMVKIKLAAELIPPTVEVRKTDPKTGKVKVKMKRTEQDKARFNALIGSIRGQMHAAVDGNSELPKSIKAALKKAIGEIGELTPKFLVSRLAGRDPQFRFEGGDMHVTIQQSAARETIGQVFGDDQPDKQFRKLLEDYDTSPESAFDAKPPPPHVQVGKDGNGLFFQWQSGESENQSHPVEQRHREVMERVKGEFERVKAMPAGKAKQAALDKFFATDVAKALRQIWTLIKADKAREDEQEQEPPKGKGEAPPDKPEGEEPPPEGEDEQDPLASEDGEPDQGEGEDGGEGEAEGTLHTTPADAAKLIERQFPQVSVHETADGEGLHLYGQGADQAVHMMLKEGWAVSQGSDGSMTIRPPGATIPEHERWDNTHHPHAQDQGPEMEDEQEQGPPNGQPRPAPGSMGKSYATADWHQSRADYLSRLGGEMMFKSEYHGFVSQLDHLIGAHRNAAEQLANGNSREARYSSFHALTLDRKTIRSK